MMTIRNNNFDFIRFLFAMFVVIAHSYALSGSGVSMQYLSVISNKQLELSTIGLNGFFIISGYLIFKSLQRTTNLISYYLKRCLRIFPGLFVVLLITLLLIPFVYINNVPFYKNIEYYSYLSNNLFLFNIQYSIEGAYSKNTYHKAINGSLWTLYYEFFLYILLSCFYIIRRNRCITNLILIVFYLAFYVGYVFYEDILKDINCIGLSAFYLARFGGFFLFGSLMASLKIENLKKKNIVFTVLLTLIILCVYLEIYNVIEHFLLSLLVLIFAFLKISRLNSFGLIGDLSYGIYIYSFLIQQTLMYFFKLNGLQLLIYSILLSIIFGFLSWHLVEKKALSFNRFIK